MEAQKETLTQLTNQFGKIVAAQAEQEAKYKEWNKAMNEKKREIELKLIEQLQASGITSHHGAAGMVIMVTKSSASALSTENFTNWIKQDPERLQYATIKPRQETIKQYVEQFGVPMEGVKFERYKEINFKKG